MEMERNQLEFTLYCVETLRDDPARMGRGSTYSLTDFRMDPNYRFETLKMEENL